MFEEVEGLRSVTWLCCRNRKSDLNLDCREQTSRKKNFPRTSNGKTEQNGHTFCNEGVLSDNATYQAASKI